MKAPAYLISPFLLASVNGTMFEKLWEELPWKRIDNTPRKEYWANDFGMSYTYGSGNFSRTYEAQPCHPMLKQIQSIILGVTGCLLEGCFVNGYVDGSDHLGWHSDNSPEIDATKPIVVISIGAEREIWFREIGNKDHDAVEKVKLPSGSMLVMKPGMQQTHEHRIPKASFTPCPPRVSLTYRGLVREDWL